MQKKLGQVSWRDLYSNLEVWYLWFYGKRLKNRERCDLNWTRLMTTAYLRHGDCMLLMQRAAERQFRPGIWFGT